MSETNLTVKMGYKNSEQSRQYSFGSISAGAVSSIKGKILAINSTESLQSAMSIFVDDDGNEFNSITYAMIENVEETKIPGVGE